MEAPTHLKDVIDILEKAPEGSLRSCVATPPQHGKTIAILHAIVMWLLKYPDLKFAYITYSQTRAEEVARMARRIAAEAGLELTLDNLDKWETAEGGGIRWTSVGGMLTGYDLTGVAVIDDPVKGREDAESETMREKFRGWYDGDCDSRLHEGSSVILVMTRWHVDDPSGWLQRERDFDYVNLKAISDGDNQPANDNREPGKPLWPAKHSLERLEKRQHHNPWNFASLYQGMPRPRGGAVFGSPRYYRPEALPKYGYIVGYGVDLAYSERTSSDWSVCVEMWVTAKREVFVVNVDRKQIDAPTFSIILRERFRARRGNMWMYGSGPEKGSVNFMNTKGVPLVMVNTRGRDKLTRSHDAADAWNGVVSIDGAESKPAYTIYVPDTSDDCVWLDKNGRPRNMEWADAFVDELQAFTGLRDPIDDQVDAYVSGFDGLTKRTLAGSLAPGAGRTAQRTGTSNVVVFGGNGVRTRRR